MALTDVELNAGTGGAKIKGDSIAGAVYEVVKLGYGAIGVVPTLVDGSNPLPTTAVVTNAGTFAVQVSSALPAGSNTIGKVDITSLVALPTGSNTIGNIGQITTSITPGTGATNLCKAVDAPAGSSDTGIPPLAIRDDALSSLTPVEGDYAPLRVNSTGALWVQVANAISGSTDDAAFAAGTDTVLPAGYLCDETATDSVDEGDVGVGRMTGDRKQIVTDYAHAAAGGTSSYSALATAAVLTAQVKGSAGKVYSVQIFNNTASAKFARLYNQTGAPASTDTANIVWRGIIPASSGLAVQFPKGRQFTTGIGIRASGAIADNDTTALSANDLAVNVDYI